MMGSSQALAMLGPVVDSCRVVWECAAAAQEKDAEAPTWASATGGHSMYQNVFPQK